MKVFKMDFGLQMDRFAIKQLQQLKNDYKCSILQ